MNEPAQDRNKDPPPLVPRTARDLAGRPTRQRASRGSFTKRFARCNTRNSWSPLAARFPLRRYVTYTLDSCHRYGIAVGIVPVGTKPSGTHTTGRSVSQHFGLEFVLKLGVICFLE